MTSVATMRKLAETTGYDRFEVQTLRCKAKLPPAVWRSLAAAERPYAYKDITVVAVDDADETVVAMPSRHYDTMVNRIYELERWIAECLEGQQS